MCAFSHNRPREDLHINTRHHHNPKPLEAECSHPVSLPRNAVRSILIDSVVNELSSPLFIPRSEHREALSAAC